MISYIVNANFSGKGYMTEAINAVINTIFNMLNLNKVYAKIECHNLKSKAVAMRCGMMKVNDCIEVISNEEKTLNMQHFMIERINK